MAREEIPFVWMNEMEVFPCSSTSFCSTPRQERHGIYSLTLAYLSLQSASSYSARLRLKCFWGHSAKLIRRQLPGARSGAGGRATLDPRPSTLDPRALASAGTSCGWH